MLYSFRSEVKFVDLLAWPIVVYITVEEPEVVSTESISTPLL